MRRNRFASYLPTGFTLLELMIVISIIVILATIALPMMQKNVQAAKEATLRNDLHELRRTIDRYAADKGKLPQSLDELVDGEYIREVPLDPLTRERNWTVVMGKDSNAVDETQGVKDIHSAAPGNSLGGTPYSEW